MIRRLKNFRLIRLLYYLLMERMKKEIWKLLELLCEFEKKEKNRSADSWDYYQNWFHYLDYGQTYSELWLITKKYGFIQRLVEQDKIDFEHMKWHWKIISYLTDEKDYKRNQIKEYLVLMLLSISEQPIELLLSVLK